MPKIQRKPEWLKRRLPPVGRFSDVTNLLADLQLHTVCREAHCPNRGECHGDGTATFLLLGPGCTRNCAFCAVTHGMGAVDDGEPDRVAEAAARMDLRFAVVTMVTRDDLADGGAGHVARTIQALRDRRPQGGVEVLISDMKGNRAAIETVLAARPDVLNHNLETVPRLYAQVRPGAVYQRSLDLIAQSAEYHLRPATKSGLMLGLGETRDEIRAVLNDLKQAGCDLLTLGQYLQPSDRHHPVAEFVPPQDFDDLAAYAREIGFKGVAAGPYVRSSYRAAELHALAVQP